MAATPCTFCGVLSPIEVQRCRDGYFVGATCDCGGESRLSRVFPSHEDAQKAMDIIGAREQGRVGA